MKLVNKRKAPAHGGCRAIDYYLTEVFATNETNLAEKGKRWHTNLTCAGRVNVLLPDLFETHGAGHKFPLAVRSLST